MAPRKKVLVIERKLGREDADGLAYPDHRVIEIDPSLPPRHRFKILVHETLHIAYPDMSEAKIKHGASLICDVAWRQKYRRTHQ